MRWRRAIALIVRIFIFTPFPSARDPVLADELTAETFYRALLSLEADASSVRCWLLRVCKNLFYDLLRRRKRAGDRTVPESIPIPRRVCWNS